MTLSGIKACMEAMRPVYEEPYEVSLDNHGCQDGPRTGRLRVLEKVSHLMIFAILLLHITINSVFIYLLLYT